MTFYSMFGAKYRTITSTVAVLAIVNVAVMQRVGNAGLYAHWPLNDGQGAVCSRSWAACG